MTPPVSRRTRLPLLSPAFLFDYDTALNTYHMSARSFHKLVYWSDRTQERRATIPYCNLTPHERQQLIHNCKQSGFKPLYFIGVRAR